MTAITTSDDPEARFENIRGLINPKVPLLVLDVDGVLAPFADDESDAWTDWEVSEQLGYTMAFSKEMTARLGAVTANKVWLTTWEDDANKLLVGPLGWQPLPTLIGRCAYTETSYPGTSQWWKLRALNGLLVYLDRNRVLPKNVIWVDDDIRHQGGVAEFISMWETWDVIIHTISPNPDRGLSPEQLAEIEALCR